MDQTTSPSLKLAGPRACMTCAKAKVKCIPRASFDICDRCHRLKKLCFSQAPAPPRKRTRKPTMKKPSRVGALERRIDELSSRLAVVDGSCSISELSSQACSAANPRAPVLQYQITDNVEVIAGTAARDTSYWDHQEPITNNHAWPVLQQPSTPFLESINPTSPLGPSEQRLSIMPEMPRHTQDEVVMVQTRKEGSQDTPLLPQRVTTNQEAMTLLVRYRTQMQHYFPFVIVPPELSGAENRQQRPFLWKAVKMAAVWREKTIHGRLGKRLLRDLTEAVLLRSYKSFDAVQGLLVLIAWYHGSLDRFQLTNLLGLLQSLCVSLNLGQNTRGFWQECVQNMSDDTLEQGRAYCGWYYLSTLVFTLNPTPEISPHTRLLDQLCNIMLSQTSQQPLDQRLVALVQIQRLAQRIVLMKTSREMNGRSSVPLNVVVVELQQQISTLKESLSAKLMLDLFLQAHLLILEMMLYEVAISDPSFQPVSSEDSTVDHSGQKATGGLDIQARFNLLDACLASIKNFLVNRLSHDDVYSNMSYITSFDMTYCLELCKRLIALREVPGWEPNGAQSRLGLDTALLKRQIEDLKRLPVTRNAASCSQSFHVDEDEDKDADAECLPTCTGRLEDMTKPSFECVAEHLKSVFSYLTGEEEEEIENSGGTCTATPKTHYKKWNADEQRRRNTNLNSNTMNDVRGQESRPDKRRDEVEASLETAAPAPSPPAGPAGRGREPAVSQIGDAAASPSPAGLTMNLKPFPSGVFPQISFWPRMLQDRQ